MVGIEVKETSESRSTVLEATLVCLKERRGKNKGLRTKWKPGRISKILETRVAIGGVSRERVNSVAWKMDNEPTRLDKN